MGDSDCCSSWVCYGFWAFRSYIPIMSGERAFARPLNVCPNGHCYGTVTWDNGILGAITWFNTVNLYSVNDGVDHISEELWLIDTNSKDTCYINSVAQGGAWVEIGEATRIGYNGDWYFWADCRPGATFYPHWASQITSGFGNNNEYLIDTGYTEQFNVSAVDAVGNLIFNGTSTSNKMQANEIEVGLETTNNSYSTTHADNDYFTKNQYHGLNGYWNFQGNGGSQHSSGPPYWYWNIIPAGGNNGGQGETTCC